MNSVARDLVIDLSQRARRQAWELDSLCNRFGLGQQSSGRAKISDQLRPCRSRSLTWQ